MIVKVFLTYDIGKKRGVKVTIFYFKMGLRAYITKWQELKNAGFDESETTMRKLVKDGLERGLTIKVIDEV